MSDLLYSYKLDDEVYPYWVGTSGLLAFQETPLWPGIDFSDRSRELTTRDLEIWCENYALRGFDYFQTHDSFNGSHILFQFRNRIDAIRFILSHPMADKRIRE